MLKLTQPSGSWQCHVHHWALQETPRGPRQGAKGDRTLFRSQARARSSARALTAAISPLGPRAFSRSTEGDLPLRTFRGRRAPPPFKLIILSFHTKHYLLVTATGVAAQDGEIPVPSRQLNYYAGTPAVS